VDFYFDHSDIIKSYAAIKVTVHGVFTYIVPIIYLYAIYSVSEQIEIIWYTIYGIH
jgi:hypothetical protein